MGEKSRILLLKFQVWDTFIWHIILLFNKIISKLSEKLGQSEKIFGIWKANVYVGERIIDGAVSLVTRQPKILHM